METPYLLVVEDDRMLQEFYGEVSKELGLNIIQAFNGVDAEKIALKDERVRCIILDMMIPLKSGEEVLQSLNKRSDHAPVIVVSAIAELTDDLADLQPGDVRSVVKGDVSIRKILQAVKAYFATLNPSVPA